MERRFWYGVGILLLFLVLGLWIAAAMDNTHAEIAEHLTQAAQAMLSGEREKSEQTLRQAQRLWQRSRLLTAAASDHSPMEEIDSIFAQLEGYAAADDRTAFAAWCSRAASLVEAIGEAHRLTWQNLL